MYALVIPPEYWPRYISLCLLSNDDVIIIFHIDKFDNFSLFPYANLRSMKSFKNREAVFVYSTGHEAT